jgi:hypothetical protein
VIVADNGAISVEPAPAEAAVDLARLEALVAPQEDRLRAAGERWVAGVTAILGLLGIAGVAVGKDAVSGLATGPRIAAAIAAGLAVACALAAIVFAYQAAYGWPRRLSTSTEQDQQRALETFARLPETIGARIRRSVYSAVAGLALLAITLGIIWFGGTAAPLVKISFNRNGDSRLPASVCGQLVDSDSGDVNVSVTDGPRSSTDTVPAGWVTKITTTGKC